MIAPKCIANWYIYFAIYESHRSLKQRKAFWAAKTSPNFNNFLIIFFWLHENNNIKPKLPRETSNNAPFPTDLNRTLGQWNHINGDTSVKVCRSIRLKICLTKRMSEITICWNWVANQQASCKINLIRRGEVAGQWGSQSATWSHHLQ